MRKKIEKIDDTIMFGVSRMRDRLHRELGRVFRQGNLTPMQFAVLDILSRRGDLSVGEIQSGILSTQGNLPVVIANLEKRGHIQRIASLRDRRVTIVRLTAQGRDAYASILPRERARLAELLAGFSCAEKKQLAALLSLFAANNAIVLDKS